MPPRKAAAAAAAAAAAPGEDEGKNVIIEEIQPERLPGDEAIVDDDILGNTTVVYELGDGEEEDDLDEEEDDEEDDEEGDEYDDEFHDGLTTVVGQLTQLFMTDEGEAITDVLSAIRDSLDKQNKILYRGLQLLEAAQAAAAQPPRGRR